MIPSDRSTRIFDSLVGDADQLAAHLHETLQDVARLGGVPLAVSVASVSRTLAGLADGGSWNDIPPELRYAILEFSTLGLCDYAQRYRAKLIGGPQ